MLNHKAVTLDEVAIICPTKNQPQKILRLLESLKSCGIKLTQIIIADGGNNLIPLIKKYENFFSNLECVYCPSDGQVLQRNFAYGFLKNNIRLVIHLDDDITLNRSSIKMMLKFWNRKENFVGKSLIGASFNIIDMAKQKDSFFRKLFFIGIKSQGKVNIAGYATPFCPASQTQNVNWLLGGATAWSRDILDNYQHPIDFKTRWAVCEDLMFSYPLSKTHKLAVVHDAIVYHNETYNDMSFKKNVFYGLSSILMRHHFVCLNKDLSLMAFAWMSIGILGGNLMRGFLGSSRCLGLFTGGTWGLILILFGKISGKNSKYLARSLFCRLQKTSN